MTIHGKNGARRFFREERPRPSSESAFTLLEVLLSLMIVATAVTLLTEGYTQALRTINANRVDTTLAFLAQWKMSEVVGGIVDPALNKEGTFADDGYPEYAYLIEVDPVPDAQGLSTVHVTVQRADEQSLRELTVHRLWYAPDQEESLLGGGML